MVVTWWWTGTSTGTLTGLRLHSSHCALTPADQDKAFSMTPSNTALNLLRSFNAVADQSKYRISHQNVDMYLQWTTMGPLKKFLKALTRRLSFSSRWGSPGTPWSGQLMNWMWVTSLSEFFSLFCRHTDDNSDSKTNISKFSSINNQLRRWTNPLTFTFTQNHTLTHF